jgi:OmcA/MtrC family decaheme c-type cytochrome
MREKGFLRKLVLVSFLLFSLGLFGCEGDEGDRGPAGPQGPLGEPGVGALSAESCDVCHGSGDFVDVEEEHSVAVSQQVFDVEITSVSIPTSAPVQPVVTFTITDLETGLPVTGLTSGASFTVAKLVPGTNGDASGDWQSYINRTEDSAIQGNTENNGSFAEVGGGIYTYTFANDLSAITTPLAVTFEPTLTHRVGVQLTGDLEDDDDTFDVVPSGGALSTRDIAATESCNNCHLRLALHGNGRYSVPFCATCHNPGTTDAESGNVVDLKVMIHKIHRGESLPSVEAGGRYFISGFNNNEHDYSTVAWPGYPIGEPQDCTACHFGGTFTTKPVTDFTATQTTDGDLWATNPTREACGSCHDDVNFDTGENHEGGIQTTNANCTVCHPPTGTRTTVIAPVVTVHNIFQLQAAADFQFNIDGTSFDAASRTLTINFSVTDPQPGDGVTDPASGSNWNILTDAPFTVGGGASRLAIDVGWDPQELTNTGSGNVPAQPISINPLSGSSTQATDNGDGTFTVSTSIPEGVNSVRLAIEGHPAVVDNSDPDGPVTQRIPVTTAIADVNTGADPTARRQVVDVMNNCNRCHGTLSLHGNNRTNDAGLCVICHNPNATDIDRRPATLDSDSDGTFDDFSAVGTDNKREQPIDFKNMIHAIHAGGQNAVDPAGDSFGFRETGIAVYGFSRNAVDYSGVRWPAMFEGSTEDSLSQCQMCHVDATYTVPLADEVLATTVQTADPSLTTQADIDAALETPDDDLNITRTAAVCSACHDSSSAQGHMIQNGASFDATQADIDAAQ